MPSVLPGVPSRITPAAWGLTWPALSPTGTVHVAGESWTAVSDRGEPIEEGERVVVAEAEGLTLKVFRAAEIEE